MAQPKVQNLGQILAELEPAYAQQRKLYGTQQAAIPAKFEGAKAGLEGAKTTGFRDIARGANTRGMDFWGTPIAEQNQYLAEKYLPGMQNLESQQSSELMQLQMALAELDKDKRLRGTETRQGQISAKRSWQEAERQRAHQAQLQREQIAAQASQSAAGRASEAAPSISRNKRGGWDVSGGRDLGQYAASTGADIITLLRQGDKKDKQAAKWYDTKVKKWIDGRGLRGTEEGNALADKFFDELRRDRPTAFYKGG